MSTTEAVRFKGGDKDQAIAKSEHGMKGKEKEISLTECQSHHHPKYQGQKPFKPSGNRHAMQDISIGAQRNFPGFEIEFWGADKGGFFSGQSFPNRLRIVQGQAHGHRKE